MLFRSFISHGPERTFAGVERFFARHAARGHRANPKTAAEYFVGMLLHKPMLYRYCEMTPALTSRQISAIARRITDDFLRMYAAL